MLVGAAAFAALYPKLRPVLGMGDFGTPTFPRLLNINPWVVVVPVVVAVTGLLWWIESAGL